MQSDLTISVTVYVVDKFFFGEGYITVSKIFFLLFIPTSNREIGKEYIQFSDHRFWRICKQIEDETKISYNNTDMMRVTHQRSLSCQYRYYTLIQWHSLRLFYSSLLRMTIILSQIVQYNTFINVCMVSFEISSKKIS